MLRYYYLTILLTCNLLYGYAQQQQLRHYTVSEGLSSNTVYNGVQDSRGFIWFCTNWGVSRFDGHHFENITSKQGLPDNEIFDMKEDPWHRQWLLCYNGKPGYIFDGKVYAAHNDPLCRHMEREGIRYHHFYYNARNEFCLVGKGVYRVTKDSFVTDPAYPTNIGPYIPFYQKDAEYIADPDRIQKKETNRWMPLLEGQYLYPHFYKEHLYAIPTNHSLNKSFYDIHLSGTKPIVKRIKIPYKIIRFVPGKNNQVFCCTEAGIFTYDPATSEIDPEQAVALQGIAVNYFFTDAEDNTWYLTAGDGVYMKAPGDIKIYNRKTGLSRDNVYTVCYTPDGKLLAGYDNGVIDQIDDRAIKPLSVKSNNLWNRIRYILPINDKEFITGTDAGLYRIDRLSGKNTPIIKAPQKSGYLQGNTCLIGQNSYRQGGGALYNTTDKTLRYLPFKVATRVVTATAIDNQQTLWLGTPLGLYQYTGNTVEPWTGDPALSDKHISALLVTPKGQLIVATPSDGLYIVDKQKVVLHLNESKGLISSLCSKACIDEQGRIWICTDKGVDCITLQDDLSYSIHHLSAAEGVPAHIINDITFSKERAYLATSEGIIAIRQHRTDLAVPSRVYILSLVHKDTLINYPQKVTLNYDQNNVVINYTCISYNSGDDITYRYVLAGSDGNDTVQTTQSSLNLGALKPGRYTLTVWAAGKNNNWSKSSAAVQLIILPPFWRTIWFMTLTACLLLLLLLWFYRYRITIIKRREVEVTGRKRRMAELEMQALRAQINPHFMFNALNAIQNYYSENDERSANYYMSAFARLIRQTLNYSKEHWIPLAEEVSILKTYIELEQMRSKHTFSYAIELCADLELEKIPTMLVQVYTENAINHGLRHLDGPYGKLCLSFTRCDNNIVCKIEDNGVGFAQAKALDSRPRDHASMGLKITEGRIATINELYNTHITVQISDKNTLQGYGQGTTVSITVPIS